MFRGERVQCLANRIDCVRDRLGAFLIRRHVLRAAMVGLQAPEVQVRCIRDAACKQCRISARRHAAALHADFDLDKPAERDAEIPRHAGCGVDLLRSIEAQRDRRFLCKRSQPPQLASAHHLIADQHVLHTAANQHFRFADLLHALPHRAARDLP